MSQKNRPGNKFSLEDEFDKYLALVKLDKRKMPLYQLRETKRAFYGACGQIMLLMRDEIAAQSEEEAVGSMQDMLDQVSKFWGNQITDHRQN